MKFHYHQDDLPVNDRELESMMLNEAGIVAKTEQIVANHVGSTVGSIDLEKGTKTIQQCVLLVMDKHRQNRDL